MKSAHPIIEKKTLPYAMNSVQWYLDESERTRWYYRYNTFDEVRFATSFHADFLIRDVVADAVNETADVACARMAEVMQ